MTTPAEKTAPPAKNPEEAARELRARVVAASPAPLEPRREGLRDTLESVVFALILAFLFRTFEAEAFVIPTGSMAPTLYGRHKEAVCDQCGARIVVGASDEFDAETGTLYEGTRLLSALCPNCRCEQKDFKDALAFNGDRILVNKFPYEIGEPNRWDVFVFKFPEEPDLNYIKRLVGLPGETIRIRHGDLFLWDGKNERILRKPDPAKQRALQMTVYDDDHPPRALLEAGWPERWIAATDAGNGEWTPAERSWSHIPDQRVFRLDGDDASELRWLRYRNIVPSPETWTDIAAKRELHPQAELVADFCGYNACQGIGHMDVRRVEDIDLGTYWVGDLTLNATVALTDIQQNAELVLELCEGIYIYRCRIDLDTGSAKLFEINQGLGQQERLVAETLTNINKPGEYRLSFANVDDRVAMWVNDTLVSFGEGANFVRDSGTGNALPQKSDLAPAGIALKKASGVVTKLSIQRDVYYRSNAMQSASLEHNLPALLADTDAYAAEYSKHAEGDFNELKVSDTGYLAFGDNSPRSRDSRLWTQTNSVDRRLLVGQAFYIYWPHGVPFLNNGRGYPVIPNKQPQSVRVGDQMATELKPVENYPKYTFPFYPQVDRMKRIR